MSKDDSNNSSPSTSDTNCSGGFLRLTARTVTSESTPPPLARNRIASNDYPQFSNTWPSPSPSEDDDSGLSDSSNSDHEGRMLDETTGIGIRWNEQSENYYKAVRTDKRKRKREREVQRQTSLWVNELRHRPSNRNAQHKGRQSRPCTQQHVSGAHTTLQSPLPSYDHVSEPAQSGSWQQGEAQHHRTNDEHPQNIVIPGEPTEQIVPRRLPSQRGHSAGQDATPVALAQYLSANGAVLPFPSRLARNNVARPTGRGFAALQAQAEFDQTFPHGYNLVDTPSFGLLCGLFALVSSIRHQFPQYIAPRILELHHIATQLGLVNNFSHDELALILLQWSSALGSGQRPFFHVGLELQGIARWVSRVNEPAAQTVWIHNDNGHDLTGGESLGHYSGLTARLADDAHAHLNPDGFDDAVEPHKPTMCRRDFSSWWNEARAEYYCPDHDYGEKYLHHFLQRHLWGPEHPEMEKRVLCPVVRCGTTVSSRTDNLVRHLTGAHAWTGERAKAYVKAALNIARTRLLRTELILLTEEEATAILRREVAQKRIDAEAKASGKRKPAKKRRTVRKPPKPEPDDKSGNDEHRGRGKREK